MEPDSRPPAPPPAPAFCPPPPPPATIKYSTVPVANVSKEKDPTVEKVWTLYPPAVVIVPPVDSLKSLDLLPNGLVLPRIVVMIGIYALPYANFDWVAKTV
jgi:hypothetical protein